MDYKLFGFKVLNGVVISKFEQVFFKTEWNKIINKARQLVDEGYSIDLEKV